MRPWLVCQMMALSIPRRRAHLASSDDHCAVTEVPSAQEKKDKVVSREVGLAAPRIVKKAEDPRGISQLTSSEYSRDPRRVKGDINADGDKLAEISRCISVVDAQRFWPNRPADSRRTDRSDASDNDEDISGV